MSAVSVLNRNTQLDEVLYCSLWEQFCAVWASFGHWVPWIQSCNILYLAVLCLNVTKWRLRLCHGIFSHHSFRPGHRNSPEYAVLTFAMSSTITCVLFYLHREATASLGSEDIGRWQYCACLSCKVDQGADVHSARFSSKRFFIPRTLEWFKHLETKSYPFYVN